MRRLNQCGSEPLIEGAWPRHRAQSQGSAINARPSGRQRCQKPRPTRTVGQSRSNTQTPHEKLAESLAALHALQKAARRVIQSREVSRVHRERLLANGFLLEVMKGWLIL